MERTAFTGKVKTLLTVVLAASVTLAVKETAVAAGGVPLRVPKELRVSQLGRFWPAHVYPALPPEAVRVLEYATPIVAGGRGLAVLMVRAALTGRVKFPLT
jgi:hypothetical protein